MSSNSPYVVDVTEENFEMEILNAPEDVTVLVDFWAPWCGPCKMLTPVLENIAESYNGRIKVAKINTDENEQLSMQFGIQGIPAVKIFQGGQMVHEFSGALPEAQVQKILDEILPSETDDIASNGLKWLEEGETEKARQCFENAYTIDPDNSAAKLGMGLIAFQDGDCDKAEEMLKSIEITDSDYEAAEGILNRIEFKKTCQKMGGRYKCAELLDENEDDLDARYGLACCLAAEEQYKEALEEFLAVVKKNKTYKDGAVTKAMVKVFSIIGQRHPMADEYRDKLEWILY